MACHELDDKQLDAERIRLERQPLYVAGDKGRAAVDFHFNLDPAGIGESLFVVFSNKSQAAVYRGPYRSNIKLEIDDLLTSDKHYDNLEFWLLQSNEKQLCLWTNELGEPYWRPGAHVVIGFLNESTLDREGLSKRFDVTIQDESPALAAIRPDITASGPG